MGDGDYPGGPTDWKRFDVPQLADFLAEDLGQAHTHAAAWYWTAVIAESYRVALQQVRDGLAKVWSPQRSPAAAMYLGRLDSMIGSLVDMHSTGLANGDALNGVLTTLEGVKRRVDQLNSEWRKNSSPLVQANDPQLVTESWKVPLNQLAQQHMSDTDNAVFAYQARMVAPMPWAPGGDKQPDSQPLTDPGGSAGSANGASAGGRSVRPPVVPPVHLPEPSGAASAPGGAPPSAGGPVLTGAPVLGVTAGAPGGTGVPGGVAGGGSGSGSSGSWMVDTPAGRVLRAGVVIGMPSESDGSPTRAIEPGPPGRTSASSPSRGAPASSGEASERGAAGLMGGPGGIGARSGQDRRRRGSEPFVEWEVPKGGAAGVGARSGTGA